MTTRYVRHESGHRCAPHCVTVTSSVNILRAIMSMQSGSATNYSHQVYHQSRQYPSIVVLQSKSQVVRRQLNLFTVPYINSIQWFIERTCREYQKLGNSFVFRPFLSTAWTSFPQCRFTSLGWKSINKQKLSWVHAPPWRLCRALRLCMVDDISTYDTVPGDTPFAFWLLPTGYNCYT
jgi:hypothetical protein